MLKTVSSITNAIGALNFKGTWNASTNTPTLASGVGTKGDYFVVSVAGSTTLDGISNWGVGDWATYNGTTWQRVEGGADLNGVNLSVSGTSTLSGLTASTALALNASKEIVSVTNTGTGNNVLATTPTLVGDVTLSTGNLVIGTDGKGIDFSATPGTGTSELLADYEEGTYTPTVASSSGSFTTVSATGRYTKIGRAVTVNVLITITDNGTAATNIVYTLPFAAAFESVGCGREMDSTGDMVSTTVAPSSPSTANIQKYNNTYPGGTGFKIQLTMTYIV
jgi:hypothetical protein